MNPADEKRYDRQIKLPTIGNEGQQQILDSRVLIIGLGGLGSPAALYLAAAGVGHFMLSDFDVVEESNLQRQIIHTTHNLGELKTRSARASMMAMNPDCRVDIIDHALENEALLEHIVKASIVLDCSDNFPTRFAVNKYCVATRTPLVSAAAIRMEGQIMCYIPDRDGPCYQCLYSAQYENTQTCESEGVLGPVVGVMGTMQALDALLIITGQTDQLVGKLLMFDGLNMQWQQVQLPRNPACTVCGEAP